MTQTSTAMHTYLRAWRKLRGLSQEQVANKMGVAHTTVGRWERGEVPFTSEQFQKLAEIFEINSAQLLAEPNEAEMVEVLERAYNIVRHMSKESLEHWLKLGEKLSS